MVNPNFDPSTVVERVVIRWTSWSIGPPDVSTGRRQQRRALQGAGAGHWSVRVNGVDVWNTSSDTGSNCSANGWQGPVSDFPFPLSTSENVTANGYEYDGEACRQDGSVEVDADDSMMDIDFVVAGSGTGERTAYRWLRCRR